MATLKRPITGLVVASALIFCSSAYADIDAAGYYSMRFPRYRLPLDTQLSQIDGVRVSYATEERDER
jgi:hypothetical protein